MANGVSGDQIESASTTWKVHSEAPTKIGGKDSFPRKRTQKINVLSRDHVNYRMTQTFNSEFLMGLPCLFRYYFFHLLEFHVSFHSRENREMRGS